MRKKVFTAAEYLFGFSVVFFSVALHGSPDAVDQSVSNIICTSSWVTLLVIGTITGKGLAEQRPDQTFLDWFLQERFRHLDFYIAVGLAFASLWVWVGPPAPGVVYETRTVLCILAGSYVIAVAVMSWKIDKGERADPIFQPVPEHLERLTQWGK